jgi:hypothetical protein
MRLFNLIGAIGFATMLGGCAAASSPPPPAAQTRFISLSDDGFYRDMMVTPDGTIYWPNYDEEAMYEFAPGASSPTNVFPTNGSGVGSAEDYW